MDNNMALGSTSLIFHDFITNSMFKENVTMERRVTLNGKEQVILMVLNCKVEVELL